MKTQAAVGKRYHQAACVYPCEFNTSFMPETARPTGYVGCFAAAACTTDQSSLYEEAEANAIGTEYVRADLLPDSDAGRVRELLKKYLDQRILFSPRSPRRSPHVYR